MRVSFRTRNNRRQTDQTIYWAQFGKYRDAESFGADQHLVKSLDRSFTNKIDLNESDYRRIIVE